MDWFYIHSLPERQLMVLFALVLSAVAFGPLGIYRRLGLNAPPRLIQQFITRTETKLNRTRRSSGTLVYRGIVLLGFMSLLALAFAFVIHALIRLWPPLAYGELFLLAYLIPLRHVWDETRATTRALARGDTAKALKTSKSLARRHERQLDSHGIIRVNIEYLAENFADKILCPLLWYLALGLPGALLARQINTLDGIVGHRSKRYIAFGWATAKTDDLIQWIPARLSALLFCVAAFFVPRGRVLGALHSLWRDARKTASPNSGYPIAAMAGALHVTLGGPRQVGEGIVQDAWLGSGSAKVALRDLKRAQWLYAVAGILLIFSLAASAYSQL
jgi:adenosylcobinamide-phosphate synthase